jgi:hypothetical protein
MSSLSSRALKAGLFLVVATSVALVACAPTDAPVTQRVEDRAVASAAVPSTPATGAPGPSADEPGFTPLDCPLPLDGIMCGTVHVRVSSTASSVFVAFAFEPGAYASTDQRTAALGRIDERRARLRAAATELAAPDERLGVLGIELQIAALNVERDAVVHAP